MTQHASRPTFARRLFKVAAPVFNAPVTALLDTGPLGRLLNRNVVILEYTGRRSGRTFSMPVAYRRDGDRLVVGANMPEAKTWWRNFLGAGGPVNVRLADSVRPGHAVATRDSRGRVTVTVEFTD